ncbi:MAG TPA: hypothetical protein VFE29_06190 [Terriglobia bacterium]|nr:hypothetical protein [Terriglobia bacterium]
MSESKTKNTEQAKGKTPAEDIEEWIFSVKSSTGEVVKIEQLDTKTGERKEIPLRDYAAACQSYYRPRPAPAYRAYGFDPYAGPDPYGYYQQY